MSGLDEQRAALRKTLRELWVEREMARNRIRSRPIMSEYDQRDQAFELALCDEHYEQPISYYTRRLVEAKLATERSATRRLNPPRCTAPSEAVGF